MSVFNLGKKLGDCLFLFFDSSLHVRDLLFIHFFQANHILGEHVETNLNLLVLLMETKALGTEHRALFYVILDINSLHEGLASFLRALNFLILALLSQMSHQRLISANHSTIVELLFHQPVDSWGFGEVHLTDGTVRVASFIPSLDAS